MAARLDVTLVARIDRLVSLGVVATRTELIERAARAWLDAADLDRWSDVIVAEDTGDEGFEPTWEADGADWAQLYGDVLDAG